MFESRFSKTRLGGKHIWIQDMKKSMFKFLLQFMYMGRPPLNLKPKTMYSDALENKEDVSMEELFLATGQYDIKELHEILKLLLMGFNMATVILFLFRSTDMFHSTKVESNPLVEELNVCFFENKILPCLLFHQHHSSDLLTPTYILDKGDNIHNYSFASLGKLPQVTF